MSQDLILRRDHLADNRRMVIARSIAASMAEVFPLPVVDEWMSSAIKRGTMKRIAEYRGVDVDADAIRMIADGISEPPEWASMVGGTLVFKILTRTWKKVLIAYVAVRRTKAASRNFLIATLFDHYCARLHIGLGLTKDSATELRQITIQAINATPGGLGSPIFRRAMIAAAKASARAPLELLDIASGGAVRRMLTRGNDEVEVIAELDSTLDAQLRSNNSFLARAVTAVEFQLSIEANPFLDELIGNFERLWNDHSAKTAPR